MKAARLHEYDAKLVIEDVPDPEIAGPHDVIVKVGAAGVCRTDLHVIEQVWRETLDADGGLLPYTIGHENAGWVEAVGDAVTTVKAGDKVICHPLATCGVCAGCRRGEDMYCEASTFPGLNVDGGYAEFLHTNERALIKLADSLAPTDVAPLADAGITAYRVVKKAVPGLQAGSSCVIIGAGGLGHIAVQSLKALCPTEVIVVDTNPEALSLAKEIGADHVIDGKQDPVSAVKDITDGLGSHAVIDFVAEHGTTETGPNMIRNGGTYYVVGYGGMVNVPALQIIFSEIAIVGSLVGNYTELTELMDLAAAGKVTLHSQQYSLDDANQALDDLHHGKVRGRAVLVP
jgi:NAD+-dependent secondary alcohol dehydrogenase Adh1